MLKVENLSYRYRSGQEVLRNLAFTLAPGQVVCLLGQNGAGKSTLFKCLLGILQPDQGRILIEEQLLSDKTRQEIAGLIAYIPQKQQSIFHFTVFDMVLMGTAPGLKSWQQPGTKERALAEKALAILRISHLKERIFSQISGGEQQLVIIARSLAQQSRIIIMDEPCANLDFGNQIMVLEMIQQLARQGYLIIQSTHDPNQALQYADQVLILKDGLLLAQGRADKILTSECLESLYEVPVSVDRLAESQQRVCLPKKKEGSYVENL